MILYVNNDIEVGCKIIFVVDAEAWYVPRRTYCAVIVKDAAFVSYRPS